MCGGLQTSASVTRGCGIRRIVTFGSPCGWPPSIEPERYEDHADRHIGSIYDA